MDANQSGNHYTRRWQYLAVFTANLSAFTSGMMYGWTSPALIKLMAEDSHIAVTIDQSSWITSLLMVGGIFGCIIISLLIDRIGRRWSVLLSSVPSITCWLMLLFAQDVKTLYAARFIGGLGVGASFTIIPMYVGEVSDDSIRGAMGSLLDTVQSVGIFVEYMVGPYVSYQILAGVSTTIPLLLLILSKPFVIESPYFLLMNGKQEKAHKSLIRLRGTKDVDNELIAMSEQVHEQMKHRGQHMNLFTQYGNRKALIIMLGLMAAQQFSGVVALLSYTEMIFEEAGGTIASSTQTIVIGVAQLLACIGCTLVADKYGRRNLLLISSLGSAICLAATGTFFFMKEVRRMDVSSISTVPIVTMILYIIVVNVGLSSQPFVLLSELFPTNVKAMAVCVATIFVFVCESIVTKLFEVVMTNAGLYMSFWIYAVCSVASFVFIWTLVPETKGRSLEEIQMALNRVGKDKLATVAGEKKEVFSLS